MELRRRRVVKKMAEERRDLKALETWQRAGWWDLGTRARMFTETSSGRDGMRVSASDAAGFRAGGDEEVDMDVVRLRRRSELDE